MSDATHTHGIVLLSGGLDSATALAIARRDCELVTALSFDYGQRHRCELAAAEEIARRAGVSRRVVSLDLRQFGGSALTEDGIAVPKEASAAGEIPATYVPARNTIFLSYALALAEVSAADAIYLGVNALDYSGYPDCRPEFVERFQSLTDVATKRTVEGERIEILAPLIELTKAEIIKLGTELRVDYSLTISCYDPDEGGRACGECDSCRLRRKGFTDAGISDPTRYQSEHPGAKTPTKSG